MYIKYLKDLGAINFILTTIENTCSYIYYIVELNEKQFIQHSAKEWTIVVPI